MQDPKGDYLPPPPPPLYQVTSDIPPDSPYHYAPAPRQTGRQAAGWLGGAAAALFALFKYGGVLLLKLPALGTLVSVLISFAGYAWLRGPWFAAALISMIFVHEMGHVLEIRRQGMQASAPLFIPFLGAAIFQRSHPTDAYHQALIGIAGPIAGTVGATVAFALFGVTGWGVFLLMALLGFYINLFNLLPIAPLDGGWVLAPLSKWVFVGGFAILALAVLALHVFLGPILFLVLLFGIPAVIERFRNDRSAYYQSVPQQAK